MKTIDAAMVQKMFLAGAKKLDSQKERINDLNVFPVPDGDTGTNMTMTIMSAAEDVSAISDLNMTTLSKAIAGGSLKGARGNSGVIFSQLCRGFTKEIAGKEQLDVHVIALAAQHAAETAYKAVMKPKEGTILTVAKAIADKAEDAAEETDDIKTALQMIIDHAEYVLSKTPDMLPILKEAGVVDSGGQGLVCVLHGFMDALTGKESDFSISQTKVKTPSNKKAKIADDLEITFGYCTEFIIMLDGEFTDDDESELKAFLSSIGDSIVCVALDDIVKIHVHTDHPGQAFEKGLTYGQLTRMKVDNLREEVETNRLVSDEEVQQAKDRDKENPPKEDVELVDRAFISVAAGEGLSEVFKDLGAAAMIEGGQTMNPSTKDILEAVAGVPARTVFVLPNNSNIILAANQAAELSEDKKIIVIPTKTVPQGISAAMAFEISNDDAANEESMKDAIGFVKSGQLTYAVRDTSIDGIKVNQGDYIAINDNGLAASETDIKSAMFAMLEDMVDDGSEIIGLYFGKDVDEKDAEEMAAAVTKKYPGVEVDLQNGSQPVYYYIVSVE